MRNGHSVAWGCLLLGLVAGLIVLAAVEPLRTTEFMIGWLGTVLAITHFLHQHALERNRFFKELFKEFNERYDFMNEELERLRTKKEEFTPSERSCVVDYLNLCAEEYLFKRKGYIPDEVWTSWRNGMRCYAASPQIERVWREEQKSNSYYGFDLLAK